MHDRLNRIAQSGDNFLSPACDLINIRLHADDSDLALNQGLFADGFKSEEYKKGGHPSKNDFVEFAKRIGVAEGRIDKLLQDWRIDMK